MQIGVLGSWDRDLQHDVYATAEEVGKLVARSGDVLFTGGSTGIMQAAMKGAKSENGLTVGIIPTESKEEYRLLGDFADIHIMTGMGEFGRLAPLIHSVDGVIAIAGGAGTLMEMSMAYLQGKPVVCIPVAGYITERVKLLLLDQCLDHRKIRELAFAQSAREAIELLYTNIRKTRPSYVSPQ
jgi:uncharacterized protein (TIGR00725 family)